MTSWPVVTRQCDVRVLCGLVVRAVVAAMATGFAGVGPASDNPMCNGISVPGNH